MKKKSFSDMVCSVAGAIEAIGDRWGFLLLRDLVLGLSRYDELQTSTGMPAQTLSNQLKHFEAHGLVVRRRYEERPPRDGYFLTPKGRDLSMVIAAMREWGDRWEVHGAAGPPLEAVDRETGRAVEVAFVDRTSGVVVPPGRILTKAGPGADDLMRFRISVGHRPRTTT
jgi:DNA-binding HxlR family transcriptional regulator